MRTNELKKKLKKAGCVFETHKGGSGHLTIIRMVGARRLKSQLPVHGSKELGTGLVKAIMKQLEID